MHTFLLLQNSNISYHDFILTRYVKESGAFRYSQIISVHLVFEGRSYAYEKSSFFVPFKDMFARDRTTSLLFYNFRVFIRIYAVIFIFLKIICIKNVFFYLYFLIKKIQENKKTFKNRLK